MEKFSDTSIEYKDFLTMNVNEDKIKMFYRTNQHESESYHTILIFAVKAYFRAQK